MRLNTLGRNGKEAKEAKPSAPRPAPQGDLYEPRKRVPFSALPERLRAKLNRKGILAGLL